jgi:ubiquitin-conjugating enzyme E2 J2
MVTALSRIQNEIENLTLPYVCAIKHRENPLELDIRFKGPKGTQHFMTEFHILLQYPNNYPFRPPTLTYLGQTHYGHHTSTAERPVKLLHPNIWQVAFGLTDILEGIHYLLKCED